VAGCGIPAAAQALAVVLRVANPAGAGQLKAWATEQPEPPTVLLEFAPPGAVGLTLPAIVPLCAGSCTGDFDVKTIKQGAQVRVDVVGFFAVGAAGLQRTARQKYYLASGSFDGSQALTACAAGYHMASLWEIRDTSNLQYNTILGYNLADSGQGPPSGVTGWVRTGSASTTSSITPGVANCGTWSLNTHSLNGTGVALVDSWTNSSVPVSPWIAGLFPCNTSNFVWCAEDLP
jgi:hypothetical protein